MTDDTTSRDALEQSRAETRGAFENRAQMYYYIYRELADELGSQRAAELMKRAIHKRGLEIGRKYRAAATAGDLAEVGRIFCEGSPCAGTLFEPGVEEMGEDVIVLRMTGCPLVDAWKDLGLDAGEIDLMCEIAAAVDEGTFEGAGLELEFIERAGSPGAARCLLELRVPEEAD
jgi:hypothetical protein